MTQMIASYKQVKVVPWSPREKPPAAADAVDVDGVEAEAAS